MPSAGAVTTAADALASLKHSFKWTDDLGESKQLYYKNFRQQAAYDLMPVAQWIDLLASGEVQPEARQPGDLGKPQDVLGDQFPSPIIVYRQDDDLRDWLEQVEAQERRVVEDAAYVHAARPGVMLPPRIAAGADKPEVWSEDGTEVAKPYQPAVLPVVNESEYRSRLNARFPQNRQSCSYPGECEYAPVCYGGEDIRRDPVGSGRYKARTPNHPVEDSNGTQGS